MGATPAFGQQILRWREQTVDSGWFDASGQHEAARSLTKQGNLRELFYRPSIELDVMKDDPLPDEQHVGPFDLDECCSRCSTPLFAVVAAETTGRLAFLSHLGPTIVVPLCPTCVYEHRSTSARIDYAMPERTTPDPSAARLVLGFSLPLFGGWRRRTSHVGGFPRWEQYPEFPKCPDCRRAMRFLMKVNGHSLGWGYHDPMCFVCDKCRTFSTVVQTD
jgi:hypothetical protein